MNNCAWSISYLLANLARVCICVWLCVLYGVIVSEAHQKVANLSDSSRIKGIHYTIYPKAIWLSRALRTAQKHVWIWIPVQYANIRPFQVRAKCINLNEWMTIYGKAREKIVSISITLPFQFVCLCSELPIAVAAVVFAFRLLFVVVVSFCSFDPIHTT